MFQCRHTSKMRRGRFVRSARGARGCAAAASATAAKSIACGLAGGGNAVPLSLSVAPIGGGQSQKT